MASCAVLAIVVAASGCHKTSTISVTITSPTTTNPTIEQGQTLKLTAQVNDDSSNKGVNWQLSGPGTLSDQTTSSVTYTAPPSINGATIVVIEADSNADNSKAASVNVNVTPPISVSVSPGFVSSLPAVTGTQNFTATVQFDQNSAGVNWSLSLMGAACAANVCGTLTNVATTTVTYTAPATIPPNNSAVTLTGASVADNTHSGSATITIGQALPIAVTIINKISFALVGTSAITFNASVANDPMTNGVTWALPCQPQCGSLSNATATSVTYTPPPQPAPMPPNNQAILTATSVDDGTKSDTDSFVITNACAPITGTPSGSESMLSGQYAFLAQGFVGTATGSPAAIVASFAADGHGNITGGDLDSNSSAAYQHFSITSAGSSYSLGPDPNSAGFLGCVTVPSTGGATVTFRFAVGEISGGIASQGRIIEFDDTAATSTAVAGMLRRQDASSFSLGALGPNYAFGVDGSDGNGHPVAIGGSFAISSGNISSGVTDVNNNGAVSQASGGSGTIQPISADGRATASFTTGSGTTYSWVIYVVNTGEFFILETDALGAGAITSGRALATASAFSQSSLSGNYVFHYTGIAQCNFSPCASVNLGLLGLNGGALSGTLYQYNLFSGLTAPGITGTYSVDQRSGRVAFTAGPGVLQTLPDLFVVSSAAGTAEGVSAIVVGLDSSASLGYAEKQTNPVPPLSGNYFFGVEDPRDQSVLHTAGVVAMTGGNVAGTAEDQNQQTGAESIHAVGGTVGIGGNGIGSIFSNGNVAIFSGTRLYYIDSASAASPAVITVFEPK